MFAGIVSTLLKSLAVVNETFVPFVKSVKDVALNVILPLLGVMPVICASASSLRTDSKPTKQLPVPILAKSDAVIFASVI